MKCNAIQGYCTKFIFFFVAILLFHNTNIAAQNQKVTLKATNTPINEVFKQIKSQTNLSVIYNVNDISSDKKVSVNVTNRPVTEALNIILKEAGNGITYVIKDNHIVITRTGQSQQSTVRQSKKIIKGTVVDEKNDPLIGVNVIIEGTGKGAATDINGNFSLSVENDPNLVLSYMGYLTQTVSTVGKKELTITMKEEGEVLGEVVVTALGIKREQKALSYNTQKIKGDALATVKDANFINGLNGKVAGVIINKSSSGIGGAAKVVMRGSKSIDKSNNALYVIDGVPMYSFSASQGEGRFQSAGTTEGVADINPDDIENITVLTGASAAALYGSAAANGAVLITTKSGKAGAIKIAVSSGLNTGKPFIMPEFQNYYGNDGRVTSWGAKLPDGYPKYSPTDFLQNASIFSNSVSISGGSDKNQTYVSVASTNAKGMLPNNQYNRYNFSIRNTSYFLNNRLKLDMSASYIKQNDQNMINQGEYMNPLVSAYLMPRGYTLQKAKEFETYNPSTKIYEQVWGDFSASQAGTFGGSFSGEYTMQNPYWVAFRNLRGSNRDRYVLSLSTSYDIKKWSEAEKWNISGRVRTDNANYKSTDKRYASTIATLDMSKTGYFGLTNGTQRQTYMDAITSLNRNIEHFSLNFNLGTSLQDTRSDEALYGGPLRGNGIPNKFTMSNIDQGAVKTSPEQKGWIEQTQSIFGSAEIGYNSYLYLTLTGRNDWASQLANSKQSSFFYPSVGLSAVVTEMLNEDVKSRIKNIMSYMKVRLAYSSVGSPFGRGLTTPTYAFDQTTKTYKDVSHYPVKDLRPEKTDSYEAGIDARFAQNKLNFKFTYYLADTKNQTIRSSLSSSSGYNAIYLQTGLVRNSGIELGLGYDFDFLKDFTWNTYFTMSYNKNKIKHLVADIVDPSTGIVTHVPHLDKGGLGTMRYLLIEGGTLGDIYTNADFRRDNDGNIIVDENGSVSVDQFKGSDQFHKLGSVLPDYNFGWRNEISYKGIALGALITGRVGGVVVSMTQAALENYGVAQNTADARDAGGVLVNGVRINPQNYFETRGKNRLAQYYTYSADNFRLAEAHISYKIPRRWLNNIMDISVGLTANNLLLFYCKAPFDPEAISSTGNYSQGLDYFMIPSMRSFGFNVKVNF